MRRALERTDVRLLIAAAVLGFALRLTYVLVTGDHALRGDEIEYDIQGRFILDGKWFWSTTPYGVAHESLWKTPGYVTWVGLWYWVFGPDPDHVLIVQTLIGPVTIVLAWALARRLFGERVAIAAAFLVAVYPLAWQFEARLYSESLATPIVLAVLLLVLDREPTMRRGARLQSRLMAIRLPARSTAMQAALRRISIPSAFRMSRIASETSGSSRPISRSAISTTVTLLPKRRYICANSSPM